MTELGGESPALPDVAAEAAAASDAKPLSARGAAGLAGRLSDVSRRTFLRRGALGAGFAVAAGAVPGIGSLLQAGASDAPAVTSGAAEIAPLTEEEAGIVNSGQPLVAHITDLNSGQMSVYIGERQISYQDPELAQRLLRAASG